MLKFEILTIFPEFFRGPLDVSLIKKAREKKLIQVRVHNLRDYAAGRHRSIDDRVYGGGSGMVFMAAPLFRAAESILKIRSFSREKLKKGTRVILTSPRGERLTAKLARELAISQKIVLICGHYEGVDERAAAALATEEISIGDYVLTGGEAAALVILETVARFIPGFVGKEESVADRRASCRERV